MKVAEFRVKGYDSLTRDVRGVGRPSAVVHLPKSWAGGRVMIIRLDDPDVPISAPSS